MTKDHVVLAVPTAQAPFFALALRVGDQALRDAAEKAGTVPFITRETVNDALRVLDPTADADRAAVIRRAYNVANAADLLGLSVRGVRKRITLGRLRACRVPGHTRSWLIDADQVDAEVSKKVETDD